MTIGAAPDCLQCRRFHFKYMDGNRCDAFPEGIPNAIILGEVKHTTPFPGDNGLLYAPLDGSGKQEETDA